MTLKPPASQTALYRERVISVDRQRNPPVYVLANGTNMRLSMLLALHIAVGDEIVFPIPTGEEISGEVLITKGAVSRGHPHHLYQAPIGYVTQPKVDKRGKHFLTAEVGQSGLGISSMFLPCQALRDYFCRVRGAAGQNHQPNFYEALRIPASASPAELRLAYTLRTLELNTESKRRKSKRDHPTSQPRVLFYAPNCSATGSVLDRIRDPTC